MKFWIDECLTPALVGHAHSLGYEATCTWDRGHLGMRDGQLLALAVGEEFVFVTNNLTDFMGLSRARAQRSSRSDRSLIATASS